MKQRAAKKNKKSPLVSIILAVCNRPECTRLCIESMYKYTSHIDFELIIMKNDIDDNIRKYLSSHNNIKQIPCIQNVGTAKTFNEGLRFAEGKFVVFTHSNVIFTYNWLDNMLDCMESDERAGMVVPACNQDLYCQQVGLCYSNVDELYDVARDYNTNTSGKREERLKLAAYTLLTRTELVKKLGGFSEAYYHCSHEEADLCFRMRRSGMRLIFAGDTYIHHFGNDLIKDDFLNHKMLEADSKAFFNRFGVDLTVDTVIDSRVVYLIECSMLSKASILGVGSTCGGTVLQAKSLLKSMGVTEVELWYLTEDYKYVPDLNSICENVSCADIDDVLTLYAGIEFDFIIIDKELALFENPEEVLKSIRSILKNDGQLIFTIANQLYYEDIMNLVNCKHSLEEAKIVSSYIDPMRLTKFLQRHNYNRTECHYFTSEVPEEHTGFIKGVKALSIGENKSELNTGLYTKNIVFTTNLKKDLKTVLLYPGYDFWLNDGFFDINSSKEQLGVNVGNSAFAVLRDELDKCGYRFCTIDKGDIEDAEYIMFVDVPKSYDNSFYKHVYHKVHKGKIYFDQCIRLKEKRNVKLVLFMQEPSFVMPENYDRNILEHFDVVFTFDDDMIDNKKYFKYHVSQPSAVPNPYAGSFGEKKLLTLIDSNKSSSVPGELYSKRREAIVYFENNHIDSFDFYGHGWDNWGYKSYKGAVSSKLETLSQYKFCVCFENGIQNGWITEKIFDCFFAGCVPIYLGAPNIAYYIPADTFVDMKNFKDYEELYNYISTMSEEVYNEYLSKAREFLDSERFTRFSHAYFAENVVNIIASINKKENQQFRT